MKAAPFITYDTLMAASRDAGNRSMRRAGRFQWNLDDWNAAAEQSSNHPCKGA